MSYRPNTSALHPAISPAVAARRQHLLDLSGVLSMLAENCQAAADAISGSAHPEHLGKARRLCEWAVSHRSHAARLLAKASRLTDWSDPLDREADEQWRAALRRLSSLSEVQAA